AVTPGAYTYGQSFPTVADGAAKGADGNTLAGRFEYNGNGGTLLTGDNEIGWTFVPNDTANYGTASGTVTVTAGKAAPNIVTEPTVTEASRFAGNVPVIEGGTAEGAFGEPLSGAFRWANLYTLVDGSNTLYWVFTPDDAVNYVEATGNIEVTVAGEPAPIELDFPSGTYIEDYESITALDPLSSVKIAGTVAEKISGTVVPGEFIWEDKDKLLQYGINACAWEFVPDVDADKYAELTGQCQINVTKKRKLDILPLTSSLGQLGNLYAGTELSTIALDTGLILDVQSGLLSGYDFMLEWATEVPRLKVGSYAYGINFTPFSGAGDNYEAGSYTATVEAQINKLNPPNESELYSGPDIDGRINLKTDPSSLMTETGAPVPNGRIEWAQGGGEHQLESGMPNIFEWRFVFEDPDMAQYYEECFGAISVYY
ncbi:MAG: hypothetical protein LBS99_04810, partial [Clostridiales bacterium]|nr:hypothetical protein [Clostridiales bacterium]